MGELGLSQVSSAPESSLKTNPEHELHLERQAVRKLDYTLIPVVTIFYLVTFLDRSNIGNARVAGLQKDLHLTDMQYEICVTVFFIPYIIGELPCSLLLRKIGPRFLMPTLVTIWGVVTASQGVVNSYGGLLTARAFLGLVEGPMSPVIIIYMSGFYTRKELSLRIAMYFSAAALSGAFSGLLAAAIESMDGVGGRAGWAWIFIIEGLFTVLVGIIGFFVIPSTPLDSPLLSQYEKELVIRRLERDRPTVAPADKFSFKQIMRSASSPHAIILFMMFFMLGMMLYGLAFFLPSIVKELGFSSNKTQLLSVGPFVAGFFVTLISAYFSDRYASRGIIIALDLILAIIGFSMYLVTERTFTLYGALYFIVPGVYGAIPVLAAWMSNNSEPYYRRAATVGLSLIFSTAGGVMSIWSFPSKEGPKYTKTTTICLIFCILTFLLSFVNISYLSWRNKVKKRPGVREKLLERYTGSSNKENGDGELHSWTELGDQHPDFVYTL